MNPEEISLGTVDHPDDQGSDKMGTGIGVLHSWSISIGLQEECSDFMERVVSLSSHECRPKPP